MLDDRTVNNSIQEGHRQGQIAQHEIRLFMCAAGL